MIKRLIFVIGTIILFLLAIVEVLIGLIILPFIYILTGNMTPFGNEGLYTLQWKDKLEEYLNI